MNKSLGFRLRSEGFGTPENGVGMESVVGIDGEGLVWRGRTLMMMVRRRRIVLGLLETKLIAK